MDENLVDLRGGSSCRCCKEAKARGLTYRVEQCPMPGWTIGDNWHNNIAYAPGPWIALHRICEKHGVGDQFRIHYDPSHAILMGQDTRSIFQYLKDTGYDFLIGGFHVKGQVVDAQRLVGLGLRRPDPASAATGTTASRRSNPADQLNAWKKQIVFWPSTSCPARRATIRSPTCRTARVDWLDHQLAARELLQLDVANTYLVRRARVPAGAHPGPGAPRADPAGLDRLRARTSTRRPPACTRCSTRCCAAQGIPVQGIGREAFRS